VSVFEIEDDLYTIALAMVAIVSLMLAFTTSMLFLAGFGRAPTPASQVISHATTRTTNSSSVVNCTSYEVALEFNYSNWLLCNFDGSNCEPLQAIPLGDGFYRICVPWEMSIKPKDYSWCCKVMRDTGWSPSTYDAGRYYLVVKNGCAGLVKP